MVQADEKSFSQWREMLWSTFVRLESTTDDQGFYGHVHQACATSNRLAYVHSTRQLTERTPDHIRADPQELVLLSIQINGHGFVEQDDRRARLEPGDFAIYETTCAYRLHFDNPFDQLVFRLPRPLLDRRLPNLSRQTARTFRGTKGAVIVATAFVRELAGNAILLADEGLASFEVAAATLIATAIDLENTGIDADDRVRFERLQMRLLPKIREPTLDLQQWAEDEAMSLRTFQRLFQVHGTTATKWILDQRLRGLAEDLRNPILGGRSVTELAFSWGFNDLSHFNRAFKARYGTNPTSFRSAEIRSKYTQN